MIVGIKGLRDKLLRKLYNKLDEYFNTRKKNRVSYYPHAPKATKDCIQGDIWFDTSDKMKLYYFINKKWVNVPRT